MEQVATSAVSVTPSQPVIVLPLSKKSTVPVGLEPVTVAVKRTLWPTVEGFSEDPRVVVVVVSVAEAGSPTPSTTSSAAASAAPRRPVTAVNCPRPLR